MRHRGWPSTGQKISIIVFGFNIVSVQNVAKFGRTFCQRLVLAGYVHIANCTEFRNYTLETDWSLSSHYA